METVQPLREKKGLGHVHAMKGSSMDILSVLVNSELYYVVYVSVIYVFINNFILYFRGVLCDHEVQPMTNARSQGGHSVPWISGNSQGYQNNFFNFQHQQGKYNNAKQ